MSETDRRIILGLDLSLTCTGYAVAEVKDGVITVLEKGHINNKKYSKKPHGYRLHRISTVLKDTLRKYEITDMVRERGFTQGNNATQTLFKVVGVSDLMGFVFGHSDITEIPPSSVKKTITGNGRASKEDVANALAVYVGEIQYANEDESDAVAVAVAYAIQENLIKDH